MSTEDTKACGNCSTEGCCGCCVEESKEADVMPNVIKSSKIWLKDSQGHPSISVTMLAISFWVTTLAYVLSIVNKIGPVEIRPFDVGACGAYFGLILSTYVARRFTEAKYGNPNVPMNPYMAHAENSLPPLGPLAGRGK